jgi:syntaxin 16
MEKDMLRERNEEINKIVQSIYSLNSIYKELQNLVIEQGSLLDRVDENIEKTVFSVTEARKHLEQVTMP